MSPRWSQPISGMLIRVALLLVIVVFALPFAWVAATAFDEAASTLRPWPAEPTLSHFRDLFSDDDAGRGLRNSLVISGIAMVLASLLAMLAGFGLSRIGWRRKELALVGVLMLHTFPLAVMMVPLYDIAIRFLLIDRYSGLILAHAAVMLPFLVWLATGFVDAVPRAQEEAAWVDGASPMRAFWGVVVPQLLPGLAVVAGFAFAYAWGEVIMAVILSSDPAKETLARQFFFSADRGIDTHHLAALGVLYVSPLLLAFLALRRLMIRGLVEQTQTL